MKNPSMFTTATNRVWRFNIQVTKNELLTMYEEIQTMRRLEMAANALYKAKLIRGFCPIGQVRLPFCLMKIVDPISVHCYCRPMVRGPLIPQHVPRLHLNCKGSRRRSSSLTTNKGTGAKNNQKKMPRTTLNGDVYLAQQAGDYNR